jgi:hypothetical protein
MAKESVRWDFSSEKSMLVGFGRSAETRRSDRLVSKSMLEGPVVDVMSYTKSRIWVIEEMKAAGARIFADGIPKPPRETRSVAWCQASSVSCADRRKVIASLKTKPS